MNKKKELEQLRAFNERESVDSGEYQLPSEIPIPPKIIKKSFILEGILELQKTDPKMCIKEGPCGRDKDIIGVLDKGDEGMYNVHSLQEILWSLNGRAVRITIDFAAEE